MLVLNIAAMVCIGLMTRVEFAVSAFINPVLWKLDGSAQMQAIRLFAGRLGFVMPFWYGLSLAFLLVETFILRNRPRTLFLAIASCIWAVVIVLTLIFLVPINKRLALLESLAALDTALSDHRRWDARHRVRVAAPGAAMVLFLVSITGH
jgi:uncharacterized membrane protein